MRVDRGLLEQFRAAVLARGGTLVGALTEAAGTWCSTMELEHNDGLPWPARASSLRRGRRLGGPVDRGERAQLDVVMAGGAVERLRATVAGLGSGGGRRWALDESVEMAMADWIGLNSGHGAENEELT